MVMRKSLPASIVVRFGGKMSKTYTTEVYEFGPDNDLIIKLPEELLEELKWFDGDKITWIDNNDGSFSLRKENVVSGL